MSSVTRKSVFSNFIWRFLERFGAQIVTFIVSIVLARILDPDIYGLVALVTVITTLLQVFVDSGLGNALIQKKNSDDTDFSTVFYFNLLLCILLYGILFLVAPLIASFYNNQTLTSVIRVLGLTLIISGVKNVQQAYVFKNFLFKRFFFSTLGGTISAAVVGIVLAVYGYGVWALVAQYLVNLAVDTLILWGTVRWRPKLLFSFKRLKGLFSYGWKLLISSIIEAVYTDIRKLIIGKMYTSEDLAFYNKGEEFPRVIVGNITSSIDSILLPAMAQEQDNQACVRNMTRRAIKTSAYLIWPLMVGLGVCADSVVSLLLTDKWLFCIPYLRIFCFTYAFYPIHTANLNAIKALGRSDIYLKLEIIKKVIGIAVLLSTMWFGVEIMAYSLLLTTVLSVFINSFPNKKLLAYSYLDQIKDIFPSILLSVLMGAIVYCINFINIPDWATLLIQVPLGVVIYIVGSIIFKFESFTYCWKLIKELFKKKNAGESLSEKNEDSMKDDSQILNNCNENDVILKEIDMESCNIKKILLLGGSAQQVVAVETAKRLGYYTILCDYLKDNPGQFVSDKFFLISTTDKDAILQISKKEKIDGILAYASDPAAPTASYVAKKLNLHGNPYDSVDILCNKDKFRLFLRENGFSTPKANGYNSVTDAECDIKNGVFKFPIIIKPVDSSGSKGATVLEAPTENVSEICEAAFSYSRGHRIVIEEYIVKKHKYLVGGDIFIKDGKIILWGLLNCHRDNKVNSLVPVGKSYPLQLKQSDIEKIKSTLQRLVDILQIRLGSMNVEAVIDYMDQVYLIDIGPRAGGNMIPDLLGYIFDVDVVEMAIRSAMGEDFNFNIQEKEVYYATHNLHSDSDGKFKTIEFSKEIEPYIIKKCIYKNDGDIVEYFDNASKALGIVFFKFSSLEEMNAILNNINEYIKVILN